MTANLNMAQRSEIVDDDIIDAKLINPEDALPEPEPEVEGVEPTEPVLWHIVAFGILATILCMGLTTFILGDLTMALTLSATLMAAFAVRAFLAFED